MDPFTHAFFGISLNNCLKNKKQDFIKIFIIAITSALSPDIDSLFGFITEDNFRYHRLATHSLVLSSLWAIIISGIFYVLFKKTLGFSKIFLISLMGILIHIILDCLVVWGCPLFYPFNEVYYSFNIYSIVIDPYILLLYIFSLFLFVLGKIGLHRIKTDKLIKIFTVIIIIIFSLRFISLVFAGQISTLKNAHIVNINEQYSDRWYPFRFRVIKKIDNSFYYEDIDVLRRKIELSGNKKVFNSDNNCPQFTKKWLFEENGFIADLRYQTKLPPWNKVNITCTHGIKLNNVILK